MAPWGVELSDLFDAIATGVAVGAFLGASAAAVLDRLDEVEQWMAYTSALGGAAGIGAFLGELRF